MSGESHNLFTQSQTFPKYVSDETLKRARVDTADGPSIRVAGTFSGSSTDITPISDALGTTSDTSSDPTLIGLTKLGNSSLNGIDYTAMSIDTKVGSVGSTVDNIKTAIGTTADTSSDPTLIGLTKLGNSSLNGIDYNTISIDTKVGNIGTDVGDIKTGVTSMTSDIGTIQTDVDSISTKTGTIETLLGNNIGNIALSASNIDTNTGYIRTNTANSSTTLGTKSDVAWDGITANPSVISLLKGIVNKL